MSDARNVSACSAYEATPVIVEGTQMHTGTLRLIGPNLHSIIMPEAREHLTLT